MSVAATLNEQVTTCYRGMYLTWVPNIFVLLLGEKDDFVHAPHIQTKDMLEEVMRESDVRAALNTVELSLDRLYRNLNKRICELSRTDITITNALLRSNINTLYDEEGAPLLANVNGEIVNLYKCKPTAAQVRHDEGRCCDEIQIWIGPNFSTAAYAEATSKRITKICTPKVCSSFESPAFNLGTAKKPRWIFVNKLGMISQTSTPRQFMPMSSRREDQIVIHHSGVHSQKQKKAFQIMALARDARELITSQIIYKIFSSGIINDAMDNIDITQEYVTDKLQQVFLSWPFSLLHLVPSWILVSGIIIVVLLLVRVFLLDPCLAFCHLSRDSSLGIIDTIATTCLPAAAIAKRSNQLMLTQEEEEIPLTFTAVALEERVTNLERKVTSMKMFMVKQKSTN